MASIDSLGAARYKQSGPPMRIRSLAGHLVLLLMVTAMVDVAVDQPPSLSRHLRVRAPHQSMLRAPRSAVPVAADAPAPPVPGARGHIAPAESRALPSPAPAAVFVPPRV